MSLSNIKFNTNYDSYEYDIIKEFYSKALENARYYDRVSAYFDSKILALYSKGLEHIYNNDGKIRFIFSEELTEKDYDLMLEGYQNKINENLLIKFKRAELTEEDKKQLSNIAFLIEKDMVDIKIAFTKSGILHDKFGLIYDNNDCIFFRGSNNETIAAIESNHEKFEVSCSWYNEYRENLKIENAQKDFERLWNNNFDGMNIVDLPNTIKQEIQKYNEGRIILEEDINYEDCVLADLDSDSNIIVYNKLNSNYNFERDFDYKTKIKKYVYEYNENVFIFKNDFSYVIMEKIIDAFSLSAEYNNYTFVVSGKLKDYIKSRKYEIEQRKELGSMIKNRDSMIQKSFLQFESIVKNEMTRKLRLKQMWDAFFISYMIKSANYSVPGAGKTSIVYGAFAYLNSHEKNIIDKIIVIGPKNSFKSWKDEFYECFGDKKDLKLINIQDNKYKSTNERIYDLKYDSAKTNVILINYDMINSLKDTLKEIIDYRTMLVFDEVHKVKSVNGVWSTAAVDISKNAKYKVILTGTPIPNSYVDLYSQLNILFTDEYKTYFKFTPSDLSKKDEMLTKRVNDAIYPFFCRTTKRDLNIPMPNEDERIICNMSEKEEELFAVLHRKYSKNGLLLVIRLMQASTNPKMLLKSIDYNEYKSLLCSEEDEDQSSYETLFSDSSSMDLPKMDYDDYEKKLINQIDMTSKFWVGIDLVKNLVKSNKKVLAWGIFTDTIDRIELELLKHGIKVKKIYGATPLEEREAIIEEFKSGSFDVLVTNPHTMAESVSLHKVCHDAVYFEFSFNLTHMLQSRDRINRLGLPDNQYTQYYYLNLCNSTGIEDSIDLRIYNRLKEKEKIMIDSIEGNILQEITFDYLEDIKRILEES